MAAQTRSGRVIRGFLGGAMGAAAAVLGGLLLRFWIGRAAASMEERRLGERKLSPFGTVQHLSVLPLVDYRTTVEGLATEPGVSYLVRADDLTILVDLGLNMRGEHPSPLLRNMEHLGIATGDIDMVFISHLRPDHTGGPDAQELRLSRGHVALRHVPVYVPGRASTADDNPDPYVEVVREPRVLATGIASTGPIKHTLLLAGTTAEQAMAVNLAGKGLVLLVGCGHRGLPRVLERAARVFDEPVYAVIGGLHLPGAVGAAPSAERAADVESDETEHGGRSVLDEAVEALESVEPALVAVSPHDSSELSLERLRQVFGDRYVEMKVGEEIVVQDGHRTA